MDKNYIIHDPKVQEALCRNGFICRNLQIDRSFGWFSIHPAPQRIAKANSVIIVLPDETVLTVKGTYLLLEEQKEKNMPFSRFVPPAVGDSVRIHPLLDGPSIQIVDKYYCLPVFNYASQSVEVYTVARLGELTSSYNLIGKLYSSIADEKFSEYDVLVETIGNNVGDPYIRGIVKITPVHTPLTKEVQFPTVEDCKIIIDRHNQAKRAFLQRGEK